MNYRIELLGGLRVTVDTGSPITHFRTRKTALLLAYLALHPTRRHAREELIELFWPDLELAAARDNLSGCLSSLRRQLSGEVVIAASGRFGLPPLLLASRDAVWLNAPDAVTADVSDFERALDAASADRKMPPWERRTALETATGLYRGPLLPDIYEEWALSQQTRLAQRFTLALAALAEAQEATGARDLALSTARRAQQSDPFYEAPYQTEMRLLASGGQFEAARKTFGNFAAYLYGEMGCRPSPAMQALARDLDKIQPAALSPIEVANEVTEVSPSPPKETPAPFAAAPAAAPKGARLPLPLARFWGRENEVEQLVALMQPDCPRLVTITGPGGIGKTHLSLVAAARLVALDPRRRVCWVPLADVSDERLFLHTLKQALKKAGTDEASDNSGSDPVETLAALLTPTEGESGVVVLLDNMEQLVGSGDATLGRVPAFLRLLLERVPGLTFLVTSRRILGLSGEQEFPLGSLPVPQNEARQALQAAAEMLQALQAVPSVALFVERARLSRPDFALTFSNAETVAAICCRLEGVPLALEMAAAWVRTLSLSRIREQLDVRVSALQSRRRDLPPRHRSLRATVEWSWELLDEELRDFFLRLSLFRGGFTSAAASHVGGNGDESRTLDWLAHLQEHSLLTCRTSAGEVSENAESKERFFFLEPVREWGMEKLSEDESIYRAVRQRHTQYFQALVHVEDARLRPEEQNCVVVLNDLLRSDTDEEAEAVGVREGLRMSFALANYWYARGLYALSYQFLTASVTRYRQAALGKGFGEEPELFAKALQYTGGMARFLGRFDEAERHIGEAQERYIALNDRLRAARCEGEKGAIATERGDHHTASHFYRRTIEQGREINHQQLIGLGLSHLGTSEHKLGNLAAAHMHYDAAMEIFLAENDALSCVYLLLNQSTLALQEGLPEVAQKTIENGLERLGTLDNPRLTSHFLAAAAAVAARTGQAARAVRLLASADRLVEESGAPLLASEIHDRALATGDDAWRESLSAEETAQAQGLGRAASFADAVAYARRFGEQ